MAKGGQIPNFSVTGPKVLETIYNFNKGVSENIYISVRKTLFRFII